MDLSFKNQIVSSFIGERFMDHEESFEHTSFVTSETLARLSYSTQKDAHTAIAFGKKSLKDSHAIETAEKSKRLKKVSQLLEEHSQIIANHITHEVGKPIQESLGEVKYAAGYFHWYSEKILQLSSDKRTSSLEKTSLKTLYQPVGLCFFITPWNFPLALAARKVSAAIATGCSCILRPCQEAPLTALALTMCLKEAGLGKYFQLLLGEINDTAIPLLESDAVRKVSFTGSTKVGKELYRQSAKTLKKLTLELGGNAPLIVFDDADLDLAITHAVFGKFRNSGQTCICPNRFMIQKAIYPKFKEAFIEKMKSLKIGDPFEKQTVISTALHKTSLEKYNTHLKDALLHGAKIVYQKQEEHSPVLLENIKTTMLCYLEENFSPIVPLLTFATAEQAIDMANETPYGLASYFFTKDHKTQDLLSQKLEFGMIGINTTKISCVETSFGGMKQSGFGKEGGDVGLYEYLVAKEIIELTP